MVSFWPWRRDDSFPASFEKTLSVLSKKIATTQTQLDNARSTFRRLKLLWTLYLSFAYLIYAIVLFLVVGLKNLGPIEWTGLAAAPLLIYVIRTALTAYYNYRIDTLSARLKARQTERAKAIRKLKDATKFDSTIELLEKYGGSESNEAERKTNGSSGDGDIRDMAGGNRGKGGSQRGPNWTNMPPPPTANIPRGGDSRALTSSPSQPAEPQLPPPEIFGTFPPPADAQLPDLDPPPPGLQATAEFAPNAFVPGGEPPAAPQHAPVRAGDGDGESHWYDRILDVLLGDG